MRVLYVFLGAVVVFLLGGFVEHSYGWPYDAVEALIAPPLPAASAASGPGNTSVPYYSRAQGAQDAPRNDVAAGATTDMQKCINTMVMRKEPLDEARTVCKKIITGIGG